MACDHGDPAAVDALVDGIESDVRQIDLLVNHARGGHESFDGRLEAPCWDHPSSLWQTMMDGGVRLHLLAARAAAQRMAARRRGPIVATTLWDRGRPLKLSLIHI
jgi:NAD(P)-dependent dehydrogenase (short-subunit alcohol dehydrogenase family)